MRAQFNANAWAGRLEGGYRFISPWAGMGVTPYAAAQFTTFELPNYAEQVIVGANSFALAYAAKSVTSPRSEVGFRTDRSFAWRSFNPPTLSTALGSAHNSKHRSQHRRHLRDVAQAHRFVVGGASPARDAALTSATAGMRWLNGFSLATTFEGEFSNVTSTTPERAWLATPGKKSGITAGPPCR